MKPVNVIAVTSGKGGVGKSNVSVNLACQLAKLGRRVLLMDADLGLGNIDILLGLRPTKTLADVIAGRVHLRDILIEGPCGGRTSDTGRGLVCQQLPALSVWRRCNLANMRASCRDLPT